MYLGNTEGCDTAEIVQYATIYSIIAKAFVFKAAH